MSVAFVLSGGASLGAIQVGMLRALFERRIIPDLIIGTSIGAVNGVYIASHPAMPETVDALADIWLGLHGFQIFPPDPITGLLGLIGLTNHFLPSVGLRRILRRHQNINRLEDATIPLHVIATDARSEWNAGYPMAQPSQRSWPARQCPASSQPSISTATSSSTAE